MKWPAKQIEAFCESCRRARAAILQRGTHRLYGAQVDNVLVYQCIECGTVLSVPAISTGRVYAASAEQRPPKVREFRFPVEAEDLALATNAALGVASSGEPYALPLRIGLSVAHDYASPSQDWKVIDAVPAPLRGRPLLSDLTIERIDGLAKTWGESRARVARWLLVAAYEAVMRGFVREVIAEEQVVGRSAWWTDLDVLADKPVVGHARTTHRTDTCIKTVIYSGQRPRRGASGSARRQLSAEGTDLTWPLM